VKKKGSSGIRKRGDTEADLLGRREDIERNRGKFEGVSGSLKKDSGTCPNRQEWDNKRWERAGLLRGTDRGVESYRVG